MNTIIDTPFRNLSEFKAQVGLPQNMYDKLEGIFTQNTNDAMTAYGDAKCISMIFVKRMLKDSHCEAFMNDVAIHYLSSVAKSIGIKPPYFWCNIMNSPITLPAVENFIDKLWQNGFEILSNDLACYIRGQITSDYFAKGEAFA